MHHPAPIELLLTSIVNYMLPIITWMLMGSRRSARTHCWCVGQLILAELALLMSIHDTAEGFGWRIGFVVTNLAYMLCAYALQSELAEKTRLKTSALLMLIICSSYELICLYGEQELKTAFIQFIYASWLCYLSFLAFRIYKLKNIKNAKWLAYTYLPALLGLLQLSNANNLPYEGFYTLPQAHIALFGLLLTAIFSQVVYLAISLELNDTNAFTPHVLKNELATGSTPEIKMLLAQVAHSDRQKILSELTPYLAHELSQPVSTILLEAQYIERVILASSLPGDINASSPEILSAAKRISYSAQVASRVLSNIRSFIKPTASAPTQVDLVQLVASAYELISAYAKKSDVDFLFSTSPKRIVILGHAAPLTQVLINLYRNSIDACKTSTSRTVYVTAYIQDQHPSIEIRDTGPGFINPSQAGTPYLTTKEGIKNLYFI
jgi:signal transduction histidine kinase